MSQIPRVPRSILLFLSADADAAPLCLPCYDESEERETLAQFKRDEITVVGVFTPDREMRAELDLLALRSAWADRRGLRLESAWNATTIAERNAGHALPMSQRGRDA